MFIKSCVIQFGRITNFLEVVLQDCQRLPAASRPQIIDSSIAFSWNCKATVLLCADCSACYSGDYFQYKRLETRVIIHLGKRSELCKLSSSPGAAEINLLAFWSLPKISFIALATNRRWTFPVAVLGMFSVKYTFTPRQHLRSIDRF
jgi:hypothetical protein